MVWVLDEHIPHTESGNAVSHLTQTTKPQLATVKRPKVLKTVRKWRSKV